MSSIKLSELDRAAKAIAAGAIVSVGTFVGGLATAAAASGGHLGVWSVLAVVGTTLVTTAGSMGGVYVTTNAPAQPAAQPAQTAVGASTPTETAPMSAPAATAVDPAAASTAGSVSGSVASSSPAA